MSDPRGAIGLLWEPELNLKVKAGVAFWAWERNSILSRLLVWPISPFFSFLSLPPSLSPPLLPPPFSISLSPSFQAFLLQTVDGKHQDLKYISPETVRRDEPFSRHTWDGSLPVNLPWGWAARPDRW